MFELSDRDMEICDYLAASAASNAVTIILGERHADVHEVDNEVRNYMSIALESLSAFKFVGADRVPTDLR